MKRLLLTAGMAGLMLWNAGGMLAKPADDKSAADTTKTTGKKGGSTASTTAKKGPQPTANATPAQIAAAKAAGQVWVNTASGVWHTSSSKWYGATKQGKFMSAAEAGKAGYHAAKGGE